MGPLAQNSMEKEKKYKIIKIDTGKSKTHTGKNTHLNQNKDILYIHTYIQQELTSNSHILHSSK